MKQLNICIDIDGTITDPYYYLDISNRYFNKNITPKQVTQYSLDKVYGVDEEEFDLFYKKHKFDLHENQAIRSDAKKILDKLAVDNNLYFVSARDNSMKLLTITYLQKNKIPYDALYLLGSHYKLEKAKELSCDFFIEDSYDNALYLADNGFKVVLLDTYYNRGHERDNIFRAQNWQEVWNIIEENALEKKVV
ncbi:hypothetical protein NBE98_16245 [Clostridium swellfunianum]|uniref:5' nucleotidase, NT5C type n=1 Tax=Clostridium swellfunianum TaxID=1367462 RepID=UPI00202EF066|nr:hypothetical protein [Clostridium swellfunianum]MCM0649919.1 hypothetical protein [Clostridium swellfunianum]